MVTVLYNSTAVIEACLASVPAQTEVIVVDNDSSDDGAGKAARARPDLTLVRAATNLGFGGGCNLGWAAATRPYIAFVNPDVVLEPETLSTLRWRLIQEPHGIVGPALGDAHDARRSPNRRPSVLVDAVHLVPAAGRWTGRAGLDGRVSAKDPVRAHGGPVAHVEGACFMVRRADLEAIGGFDPDLFLYCEEASLTMRLQRLGGRAFYEPAAAARHIGAHATDRAAPAALFHYFRSRVILYRKRDGRLRGALSAALLLAGALLALATALANAGLRRSSANPPALALAALRGVVSGARARLRFDPPRPG